MKKIIRLASIVLSVLVLFSIAIHMKSKTSETMANKEKADLTVDYIRIGLSQYSGGSLTFTPDPAPITLTDGNRFTRSVEVLTDMIENEEAVQEELPVPSICVSVHFSDDTEETYYIAKDSSSYEFFADILKGQFVKLT
ncbi:MAG: hypothetical protein IJ567_09155 [Lachnospiraceae bacterium]|nr:hypothetical protein [Lachnospiraceae bacterium]